MDRLTHEVIKETSKNLRYYIDVKRRENAFVLNPNSTSLDSIPLKTRYIYGTTKEYPPLYGSCHSDNDVKVYLRSFQQQQRQLHSTTTSPEKQMCREELNFHMRSYKYLPKEGQKFNELRLRPPNRASSSCSRINVRDTQRQISKSPYKISRHEQNQLIDDTADILAQMIKTRRTIYETNLLSQPMPPIYVPRNANPSPRQIDEQYHIRSQSPSGSQQLTDLGSSEQRQKQKRTSENRLEKAAAIMHNAKPITNSILCEYKVSVKTGNRNGASTNASIRIKFYGKKGYTDFINLVDSETHRVPFLKDQTDVFAIQTNHVGDFAGITIGHDQKDMRAAWFLDNVSIYDPIREKTYEIPCNAWLSSKSIDQKTLRDFQVASTISHKKQNDFDEGKDSQSVSSSTTQKSATTSSSYTTNSSQNNQQPSHKRIKKPRQRVSIHSTNVEKRTTSLESITNHLSQPPPATTIDSHYNHNEFVSPSVPKRRIPSPNISSSSSSDTEIQENVVHQSRSTTPTPSPTFDQSRTRFTSDHNTSQTTDTTTHDILKHHSTDHDRPPARLEKRHSPVSFTPEQPIKTKEKTSENETHDFFD